MRLPINFSFTSFSTAFIFQLRQMAEAINRLGDTLPFIQQVSTGSENSIDRFLSVSATLDFPSIAAGAVATLNITVTGAKTGDYVTVSAPATLEAGLTFCWIVTATDTVTIRLHNTTGAAIDPASAIWKVLIVGVG